MSEKERGKLTEEDRKNVMRLVLLPNRLKVNQCIRSSKTKWFLWHKGAGEVR